MKYIKGLFVIVVLCFILVSCKKNDNHKCKDNLSDWIISNEVKCNETTKRIKICNICNKEVLSETYTQEHIFTEEIAQYLTCTLDEIKMFTCELCGIVELETISATGHNYKEEIIEEATCINEGILKLTCEKCNQIKMESIGIREHSHYEEVIQQLTCTTDGIIKIKCSNCDFEEYKTTSATGHGYIEEIIEDATCLENGILQISCEFCDMLDEKVIKATGHIIDEAEVIRRPSTTIAGKREFHCTKCDVNLLTQNYVDNGYFKNGKLSVNGRDLVNKKGDKFQLYGLSTHGLQWFGKYANFNTIAALQEGFGMNIIRFALYTSENGYCTGTEAKKKQMLEDLIEGIDAATKLGLYVIVDWHMVGADDVADKNPLTYLEESKEFFSYISNYYKEQDNILYEIMNEPNGNTTWADCKKYAEEVIPCIRQNTDGIILIGNPKWTADLYSVMNDPLEGYENIMYTYHFYAATHSTTSQVVNAYDNGLPVFISEFGFMESSGDGSISESNGTKWKNILDQRNISYVAWNISNSPGSASIFKYNSYDMVNVEDSNLKEWGIYLKKWYKEKSGLDKLVVSK